MSLSGKVEDKDTQRIFYALSSDIRKLQQKIKKLEDKVKILENES